MKLLIIVATLGLATFVVLRRRNPELADRVEGAVKDAAGRVTDEAPAVARAKLLGASWGERARRRARAGRDGRHPGRAARRLGGTGRHERDSRARPAGPRRSRDEGLTAERACWPLKAPGSSADALQMEALPPNQASQPALPA